MMYRVTVVYRCWTTYNSNILIDAERFFKATTRYSLFNSSPVLTVWPVSEQQVTAYTLRFDSVRIGAHIDSIKMEELQE